jgi:hypothetical protein
VVGAFLCAGTAQAQQAVQWRVEDGGNGHWYRWERRPSGISWSAARLASEQIGGHLATIHSGAENGFVFNLTLPTAAWQNRFGPWLGGYQTAGSSEPGGGWRWVTDEPWSWAGWLPGEPNNSYCQGISEDSLHFINYGSGWNDLPGDIGFPDTCEGSNWSFVVEWSADCNNDNIVDYGQIIAGDIADTNTNGIPDCCEQGTPCFDADADGIPNSLDNCPTTSNPSQLDCNNNGIGEACETFTDCNSNSLPDSCDIASGTSTDADSNGVPDSCQPDCNLNGLPDAWEIATGLSTDYNADGIPDTCQGAVMVDSTTDNLGAPSGDSTREHVFAALPFAESSVDLVIDLVGDLNRVNEYVEVSLNGGAPRRFFEADGNDCPATPDRAVITLTRAEFNALILANGATNSLTVSLAGSAGVDPSECKNAALTQFRLKYVGIQPKSGDCNGNQRLDVAETFDGTTPDCNANTVPDSCDIARGAAQDCNANEVPDGCELTSTPALDCDANGIIDTCDLATGGTSIDCDQNGRIDSCQVTETPGTDCNGNLRPDACDVAGGTSADRDGDLQPDECQTVQVPGDFTTIQAAIDAAPASEMRIIAVAAGEFAGPVDFKGKPVVVRGAGAGQTVIAGTGGASVSVVRFMGSEPAISALERVSVRGGLTGTPLPSLPSASAGGGVLGIDAGTSIRDCVIESNTAGFGGGAYLLRCTGEVRNCAFRGNTATTDGGGLQANQGSVRVIDTVVEGNVTNSRGGGLHLVQGTPTLTRVQVLGNLSSNLMGGISWFSSGSPTALLTLEGCTVSGNTALISYGGIGITDTGLAAASATLQGTTVCQNTPRPNVGGGRWSDSGSNTVCDCAGDLNLDGAVNGADLGLMLSSWGACGGNCPYDLNADGVINGADLGLLLSSWGACGG